MCQKVDDIFVYDILLENRFVYRLIRTIFSWLNLG